MTTMSSSDPKKEGTEPLSATSVTTKTDSDLVILGTYVEAEITSAWTRKTSFETRAFSLVTLNLGLVTLFFALRTQLSLWQSGVTGPAEFFLVTSTGAGVVSIVFAALAAVPANYAIPSGIRELFDEARAGEAKGIREEIIDSRIAQLEGAITSNARKGTFIAISFMVFGVATLAFLIAIATAVL